MAHTQPLDSELNGIIILVNNSKVALATAKDQIVCPEFDPTS